MSAPLLNCRLDELFEFDGDIRCPEFVLFMKTGIDEDTVLFRGRAVAEFPPDLRAGDERYGELIEGDLRTLFEGLHDRE